MLRNSNKEEEKIKNKRNLDQQKCREIMNMQVQAKEKEKLVWLINYILAEKHSKWWEQKYWWIHKNRKTNQASGFTR